MYVGFFNDVIDDAIDEIEADVSEMVVAGGLLGCVNQSTWRKQLICPNEIQLFSHKGIE
jgi:hypothetical protein